jgi:MFS family permease
MGGIRAFNLLLFLPSTYFVRPACPPLPSLPVFIYFFKPHPQRDGRPPTARQVLHFDLTLARLQMFLDTLSHILVLAFPPDSEPLFVLATALTSMGAGTIPAMHSAVLGYARYRNVQAQVPETAREDVGVLFGALATLQAVGQTIIGPILFGILYSRTVEVFPKSIFVASGVCAGFGWGVLCVCVSPRKRVILHGPRKSYGEGGRPIRGRGRSTMTKHIGFVGETESVGERQGIFV